MAEEGAVINCHTIDSWNEQLQRGNDSKKLKEGELSLINYPFTEPDFRSVIFDHNTDAEGEKVRQIALLMDIFLVAYIVHIAIRRISRPLEIEATGQVVVDFTASWCGPCRFITPVLAELAKKLPDVIFLKVDVDELKSVAVDWAIEAMPTFMFLKEGKIVDKVVGARKEELHQKVSKHMAN
ncbi:hypothetical protein ACLOJK_037786 [Asimina triloba]